MSDKVKNYIESNWDRCIKHNMQDDGTLIGMPYPYMIPSVGHFDEMYYWDTYFANKGLMLSGRQEQVKYNTDNMLYLVNRYGFMPNGNRTYYLKNSQPPFLSCMVYDVYKYYKDTVWLYSAYNVLKIEYDFWQTKRMSDMGLNHYDGALADGETYEDISDCFKRRVGFMPDVPINDIARHCRTTCESGWDINPRWNYDGYNFAPVDLNSLMYMFEKNMSFFANELKNGESELWNDRAKKRKRIMLDKMDYGDCLLLDYNFVTGKHSDILSAASFFLLFAGVAEERNAEAIVKNLCRLEADYGILTCEKNKVYGTYQWNYPNGWACLQYIAFEGLDRYGYTEDARRIAQKFINLVDKVFDETGKLWEKYNVVTGSLDVSSEYGTPPMMGWSAGVYLAADNYLKT